MEGLHLLKNILEQNNYLWKLNLKGVYFWVPTNSQGDMYVSNERVPCTNSFVLFDFGPVTWLFKKLINVPVSILCKLHLKITSTTAVNLQQLNSRIS